MLPTESSTDVLVLSGGFAGLWAAVGAARRRHELNVSQDDVALQGMAAKEVKQTINCRRIYPPQNQNAADIFAAAEASVRAAPYRF